MKRLQITQKLVYEKFYVHEIAAVNLSKIYFLKNAKKTCKTNNHDWKNKTVALHLTLLTGELLPNLYFSHKFMLEVSFLMKRYKKKQDANGTLSKIQGCFSDVMSESTEAYASIALAVVCIS